MSKVTHIRSRKAAATHEKKKVAWVPATEKQLALFEQINSEHGAPVILKQSELQSATLTRALKKGKLHPETLRRLEIACLWISRQTTFSFSRAVDG